jgi:transcriptional regulator with XRE-family HTH domain
MLDQNPISLDGQLINRVRQFLQCSGVSQRALAGEVGSDPGNFSAFLSGVKSLSVTKISKLLSILNMDRLQLERKFSSRQLSSQILELQEGGEPMRLDGSGWVPGSVNGDSDPNDSTDISNTWKEGGEPSGDDLIDTLRQIDDYHRQARVAIADYIAQAGKAHPNAGSTEPPRKVTDNASSSKPGSRGDLFRVTDRKAHLVYLEEQRAKTEAALQLEKDIQTERKAMWDAQRKLRELKA